MDVSRLERMGRRRFMENLAGIGVSATTLQELTQDELTDVTHDPEEEIPYVAAWRNVGRAEDGTVQREPVYETIPREEWERREATMDVREWVDRELEKFDDTSAYATYSKNNNSPIGFGVTVRVPEAERRRKIEELLPTETSGSTPEEDALEFAGIPIDVEESRKEELTCYDTQGYDDVPGGQATTDGTLTGTFHSDNIGKDGWVASGHVAETGKAISQVTSDGFDYIGTARDSIVSEENGGLVDCAFIEPMDDEGISSYIVETDGQGLFGPIKGIILNRELDYNVGNTDYGVRLQGKTSCEKTGHIREMDGGDSIDVMASMASGDSGGPAYRVADGDAYIVGNIGEGNALVTQCTTAETIESELNGQFI